ncbi:uncharacterized protein DFE_2709 [Desulfovibrio ferrophilus]|uniref:Uncharacterized protein n=1 Tax=Desulfovibrio ferrophilus TaxID=241368 RepID=A0A2Z6B1T4_9BACT|nr:uncharacterized protein DFE_2709 [Desulfovibrio ferrophilus]
MRHIRTQPATQEVQKLLPALVGADYDVLDLGHLLLLSQGEVGVECWQMPSEQGEWRMVLRKKREITPKGWCGSHWVLCRKCTDGAQAGD